MVDDCPVDADKEQHYSPAATPDPQFLQLHSFAKAHLEPGETI